MVESIYERFCVDPAHLLVFLFSVPALDKSTLIVERAQASP